MLTAGSVRVPLAIAAVLLAGGCEREVPPQSATSIPSVPTADDWIVRAVESTGDGPAMVLVADPEQWARLYPHLRALAPALPAELAARLDSVADPSQWVRVALNAMQVDVPALALAGWDRGRPLVLALFEPPQSGPVGTIAATLRLRSGVLPGLRHQIIVPASDRAALADSLARGFAALGLTRPAWAAEGQTWTVGDSGWVALVPEADAVRIVVVSGGKYPPGFFDDPAHANYRDPAQRGAAPPRTAGMASLHREALTLVVRPQKWAAWLTWDGARDAIDTEAVAASDQIVQVRHKSLEILAACEVVYGNEAPELDDTVVGLAAADDSLRLRVVFSLTPRGAAAFDASATAAGDVLALKRRDVPASGWHRLDLKAAWKALGEPASQIPAGFECHPGGPLPLPAAPLGNMQRIARSTASAPWAVDANWRSAQFALTEATAASAQLAVAFLQDGAVDVEAARARLAGLGAQWGVETHADMRPEGAGQRVLLGVGVDPDDVFGAAAPVREISRLSVDLAALAPALETGLKPVAAALRPFPRLQLLLERSGPRVVSGELVLALAGDPPPRSFDFTAFDWQSPSEPGDRACSQRYAEALVAALRTPDVRPPTGDEALRRLASVDAAASCLSDHPVLAASQAELRRLAPFVYADGLSALLLYDDAARVLEPTCARGDAEACARKDSLRAAIAPRLPEVTRPPCDFGFPLDANRLLAVTDAGLSFDGIKQGDVAALRSTLAAMIAGWPEGVGEAFGLSVDRDMTFGAVRPVLEVLRDVKAGVYLSFRGPGSQISNIPIALEPVPRDDADVTHITLDPGSQSSSRPASGQIDNLHVHASDAVPWGEVATALARSCMSPLLVVPRTGGKPQ